MRYTEIIEELSDYDPSVKAARVGSTVTIGEIVEMAKAADTIERLQKENELLKSENQKAWIGRQNIINDRQKARGERDSALVEVERLKGVINEAMELSEVALDRPR